jgi:hypothetical protein
MARGSCAFLKNLMHKAAKSAAIHLSGGSTRSPEVTFGHRPITIEQTSSSKWQPWFD